MYSFLDNKSILVTGGTGSFGQKFVKTILENSNASRIIVFSRDELKQTQMAASISDPDGRLRFFLGDIRDQDRLMRAFNGVDYVVHAAALKHVPVLEYNPFEAVKTNILGTQNIINAAIDRGVKKVMFLSTDKAANPANLYGATKACAEKLIISGNAYSGKDGTLFSAVRYGNVLGSRGSLLKILEEQKKAGFVQLTHEDMTRFWLTLDQGVALVLMGLEKMQGGEIFIPKAPSMKVKDVIVTMAPGSEIKVIGIRPGEKMHEVLLTPEEARHSREYPNHYVIVPEFHWWNPNHHAEAKPVAEDFAYMSHTNTHWLTPQELMELINN